MEEMNNVVVEEAMDTVTESVVSADVCQTIAEEGNEFTTIDLPPEENGATPNITSAIAKAVGCVIFGSALVSVINLAKEAKVMDKVNEFWTDMGKNRRAKAVAKAFEKREKENVKFEAEMQKLKDKHNLKVKKYDQKVDDLINKACYAVYKDVKEEETKPEQEEVKEN